MVKPVITFFIILYILSSFIQGSVSAVAEPLEIDEQIESGENDDSFFSSSSIGIGSRTTEEMHENILIREVQNVLVNKDSLITYEFMEADNAITTIQFHSLENSGEIRAVIEVLKDSSQFIATDAPGNVYQQINIWVDKAEFVSPDNMEELNIFYRVENSWLEENNIEADEVKLYRYADNSWNALPTSVIRGDAEYVYFESHTPGFSHFAICSESENTQLMTEPALKSTYDKIETVSLAEKLPDTRNTASNHLSNIFIIFGGITVLIVDVYALYGKRK